MLPRIRRSLSSPLKGKEETQGEDGGKKKKEEKKNKEKKEKKPIKKRKKKKRNSGIVLFSSLSPPPGCLFCLYFYSIEFLRYPCDTLLYGLSYIRD